MVMRGRAVAVTFKLLSSIHVGYLPNQSGTVVAPGRYYVPGKNMWGALTAALTRRFHKRPRPVDFQAIGDDLRAGFRFSYLYVWDGRVLYVPQYGRNGLYWGDLTNRQFERQFVSSRVCTAIGGLGGAAESTLHDMEFVRHESSTGEPGIGEPVYLAGMVAVDQGARVAGEAVVVTDEAVVLRETDVFDGIVLGGDQNYGFGMVMKAQTRPELRATLENIWGASRWSGRVALAGHSPYNARWRFRGEIEILSGRVYPLLGVSESYLKAGREIATDGLFFAPGTEVEIPGSVQMEMDCFGRFRSVAGSQSSIHN